MDTRLEAKLIAVTQPTIMTPIASAEELIVYCAKVSNPNGQLDMTKAEKLLQYCIKNRHWSIFTMANAVVEINCPRDIARQFTRHESMTAIEVGEGYAVLYDGFDKHCGGLQEFSQRYSDQIEFTTREIRGQDTKNRQNSIQDDELPHGHFDHLQKTIIRTSQEGYTDLLDDGVAKECARVILPEGLTMSRMYVNGTLRSWLTYLSVREEKGVTQLEHVILANRIREAITPAFPTIFKVYNENPL